MDVELVDFVSIPARDGARAVAWYRDVLALQESEFTEGEVEAPNLTFSFWKPEREQLPFVANEAGVALRVPDVAAARSELEAKAWGSSRRRGVLGSARSPRSATRRERADSAPPLPAAYRTSERAST